MASAFQRVTGEDISGTTPLWTSYFTDASRQAATYRQGRVFLAGDAAHIHLPIGAQGISAAVGDVVNLGWKFAAPIKGHAPEGLLDTYHAERHPVGARIVTNTLVQRTLYLGGPEAQPLRDLFAELVQIEEVRRHLVGLVSSTGHVRRWMRPGHTTTPWNGRCWAASGSGSATPRAPSGRSVTRRPASGPCTRSAWCPRPAAGTSWPAPRRGCGQPGHLRGTDGRAGAAPRRLRTRLGSATTVRARADPDTLPLLRRLFGGRLSTGEVQSDGRVAFAADGPSVQDLTGRLAGLGHRVEVLDPPEARESLARLGQSLTAITTGIRAIVTFL